MHARICLRKQIGVTFMNDSKEEFGKRLSEIRKTKKLKQDDLKDMIEAPTIQMISNWENGHAFPSPHYLIILAEKLDISLDYLLLGKEVDSESKSVSTYKDIGECIFNLVNSGLFELHGYLCGENAYETALTSRDKKVSDFRAEFDNLLIASKTLRPELYNQAVLDLLDKYDIPLKSKESKQAKSGLKK